MNHRARSFVTGAALVGAALFAASATRAQESDKATKEKKVRELLDLNGTADFGRAQYADAVDHLAKDPNVPKKFVDRFRQETKASDLVDMLVSVYVKTVDEDVVDAAIEFYKTPAGKKLAKAQADLSRGMNEAVTTWGLETTSRILRKVGEEEEAAKKDKAAKQDPDRK